jgi:hypothetical protein
MTALKSQFQKARVVLQSLVQGLHPESGAELPKEDIVNNIEVNRAMCTAVMALDQMTARLTRRAMLPDKVGKAWTEEEEQRLKNEFNRNEPLPLIATTHGRTVRAIEARLERLGLLMADQRTTNTSFIGAPAKKEEGK